MKKVITDDIILRFQCHAGYVWGVEDAASYPSISNCLISPNTAESLDVAVADLVSILSVLNHQINGAVPSEEIGKVTELPRRLVAAISEIIRMLKTQSAVERQVADKIIGQIETLWHAVLDGDIDDINELLVTDEIDGFS